MAVKTTSSQTSSTTKKTTKKDANIQSSATKKRATKGSKTKDATTKVAATKKANKKKPTSAGVVYPDVQSKKKEPVDAGVVDETTVVKATRIKQPAKQTVAGDDAENGGGSGAIGAVPPVASSAKTTATAPPVSVPAKTPTPEPPVSATAKTTTPAPAPNSTTFKPTFNSHGSNSINLDMKKNSNDAPTPKREKDIEKIRTFDKEAVRSSRLGLLVDKRKERKDALLALRRRTTKPLAIITKIQDKSKVDVSSSNKQKNDEGSDSDFDVGNA